ncbi:MAG TPA: family 16 glycoside hydrolase, partial [Gemmataceae bacterium]|nr:family 16 glycoside hydrolase [Gemmataceae bacterium]
MINRRQMLVRSGAAVATFGLSQFPFGWQARADQPKKHVLMFTRSQGFEHPVIKRGKNNELSLAERIVTALADKHGFQVTCTKDGREFLPETLAKYDAFLFETTGDLTQEGGDKQPPMPPEGKKALLKAIAEGKGFVGCHCASDTFHSPGARDKNQDAAHIDPYLAMLGGEFIVHGSQQKAHMHVVDHEFPHTKDLADFDLLEEWYALKNFAPDLHVILVQQTHGMHNRYGDWMYNRPDFPATWARMYDKGRVFYTSMGHREDVWESQRFQHLLMGGLAWALGHADADLSPNLDKVAPQAAEVPSEFIDLFNGKDLTGWRTYPTDKAKWEVRDGILVGHGDHSGHLFTDRDDYQNFVYRIEAKISDKGNSGQYFRVAYGPSYPKGYEAQINSTHPDPQKTGSLWGFVPVKEMLVKPDEWFTQEVTAEGNHIVIKVNGEKVVDYKDPKNTYSKGCLALQMHDP